ncbi:MAG: hypothetical protein Q9M92_02130 [Enterobacterales bacterium]|nr:hypothetical protein [Enterobacterales bacterium]
MTFNSKISINVCALLILFTLINSVKAAVLVRAHYWKQPNVLNVLFLDGSPQLQQQVKTIAPQWLQQTRLSFRFFTALDEIPAQTHIRISFKRHNGSQLGDHRDYKSRFPTMNLSRLNSDQMSQRAATRLILHEFGHALGFEHEYQSRYWPYGQKPLRIILAKCYPKMEAIGYTPQQAIDRCREVNKTLNQKQAYQTAYDEASIMSYPLTWTQTNGENKDIVATYQLSYLDHYAIQLWYAKIPEKSITQPKVE